MKFQFVFVFLMACQQMSESAHAQTLTARLSTEGSQMLAQAARQRGNAVRGAVLFAEQKLGCANCHGVGRDDLLGPDLTRLGEIGDARLVESILKPSKVIRKRYETTVLLLEDGRTLNGRVLEDNANELVIRDATDRRRVHRINPEDIDERAVSEVSIMPAKLADQLKDRQQFLDLIRYVIDVVESGPSADQTVRSRGGGQISEEFRGQILLNELNCAKCHECDVTESLPPANAPNLQWLSGRVNPDSIEAFLSQPHAVKPYGRMPDVLDSLERGDKDAAAKELTHYIASLSTRKFSWRAIVSDLSTRESQAESAAKGEEYFHTIGCVACHSPRDDRQRELSPEDSVPLGELGGKYAVDSLVSFLKNPHDARPSGLMPNMQLTHWEATDIARYLLRRSPTSGETLEFHFDPELAVAGKRRFRKHGCVQCHEVRGQKADPARRPIDSSKLNEGCLSNRRGHWPHYSFSEAESNAIRAALSKKLKPTAEEHIAMTLTAQRCLNCHTRGDLGGISDERDSYFQTTNPNLGPQGRVPPTLTGVGAKLKPMWMRQVLILGRRVRPYIKTRMPKFQSRNVAHLIDRFHEVDRLPELPVVQHVVSKQDMRKAGYDLAGTGGLSCIVCHTFQQKPAATMSAVDLTNMAERLHKDWFRRYMRDPQRLSPNTVMPSFWPGGKAIRKRRARGRPGSTDRSPMGMAARRAASSRSAWFSSQTDGVTGDRRSGDVEAQLSNIGKRGIGVGYPLQVNLAFDAEQLRLAMIWKGKFLDPGGVWRSQGHGRARPLARPMEFAKGPDFELGEPKWKPENDRPVTHQFKGYTLDKKRRPRFEYSIDGVSVEDYFVDVRDLESKETLLRRKITLRSKANAALSFRIADGKRIEAANDWFEIDGRIRVRIVGLSASVTDGKEREELRAKLDVVGDTPMVVIVEYGWLR